ncbi:GtrA family protein [Lacrimispora defluvii]|uniref:Glycosyltransferase n=1 Tax=Lacrimispora defluvii TaxID=2719233 RepID=A0ABX1VVG3_9FIRM|nr:bifunctional glycosyltransferase family 2/GtrA family protein [Lacrimispora defluvii]NNJ32414.1 glycosyltransferase [Lacrimispora defluvii]
MEVKKNYIIIPAYEPDWRLIHLLKELNERLNAVFVVVNDGSSREKDEIFCEAENFAVVLYHDKNYGKGRAVKTALSFIKNQEYAGRIVIADADGQHTPEDIALLLSVKEGERNLLITGCRSFQGEIPLRSRLGNQLTRVTFWLLSGKWLKDTQTGLRAFHSSLIPKFLEISGDRYEYETNMLMTCVKQNIRIVEIPIKTIYLEGNKSSHFRAIKDSVRIYMTMLKFVSSSFLSFCIDYLLFGFLLSLTSGLGVVTADAVSNIVARIVSASFNFFLNRNYVFQYKGSLLQSALGYAALALSILAVNTAMLMWLVRDWGLGGLEAKIVVEVSIFFVNFLVQKFFVFKNRPVHTAL